jgi:TatD DNase family protein
MLNIDPSPQPLIDIGANLTHESFTSDLIGVMQRAQHANVQHCVITGSDMQESSRAIALAKQHPQHFTATAGIHPHYATEYNADTHEQLRELIADPIVRAVGETGLDYFRDISPRQQQQESFAAHLELARQSGKPMFLHQRDAHEAFVAMLREHRDALGALVVHCFTDSRAALHDYLDLDCYIGITGWICDERRGADLLEYVSDIPTNRLMIETDAPYLLPRTIKPKPKTRRNEPCTLPEVLRIVAAARTTTPTDIANATTANAMRFFALDGPLPASVNA